MQPERATRRTITIDIPQPLVDWLDQRAKTLTISRSALVRQLVALAKERDEE
jgi:metal-responsive CopG/Arc/MetJ family transcriptional regulator